MAVYKVIQDIEAEDRLLGPLTLKGLIYAGAAALLGFINFQIVTAGMPVVVKLPILIVMLMPMVLFGALASPLGRDQPTEVWLLAHIRFLLKPRQRLWNQSGLSHLVTVTAPKRIERQLTKGFSQVEVQSRLKALATTLDSRGWVVKNVNVNLTAQPDYLASEAESSDRLVTASTLSREVPEIDIRANDDILDEKNNPTAQKFETMMVQAEQKRKDELAKKIEEARIQAAEPKPAVAPEPVQAVEKAAAQTPSSPPAPEPMQVMGTTVITPGQVVPIANHNTNDNDNNITSEEKQFLERLHREQAALESIAAKPPAITQIRGGKVVNPGTMTATSQTDKLELAQSGNDFSVATIAELANRKNAT